MKNNVIQFPLVKQEPTVVITKVPGMIRKLAGALMIKLRIIPDMSLVYILGDGSEYSNQRALETWLMNKINTDAIAPSLNQLTINLETYLNNYLNNMEASSC